MAVLGRTSGGSFCTARPLELERQLVRYRFDLNSRLVCSTTFKDFSSQLPITLQGTPMDAAMGNHVANKYIFRIFRAKI